LISAVPVNNANLTPIIDKGGVGKNFLHTSHCFGGGFF